MFSITEDSSLDEGNDQIASLEATRVDKSKKKGSTRPKTSQIRAPKNEKSQCQSVCNQDDAIKM